MANRIIKHSEPLELKGYWWLPERPEDKVAGVLTYEPEGRIELELIGCFNMVGVSPVDMFIEEDGNDVPLIYGEDSDAKEISLLLCYRSFTCNLSCNFPIIRYTVRYLIYDKHIKGLDEQCDYTARVRFPELSYWVCPGAIHTVFKYAPDSRTIVSTSLEITKLDDDSATIVGVTCDNGVNIRIKRSASMTTEALNLKPSIEQFSQLEISKPEGTMSLKEILHEIHKFESFLSLATKRTVIYDSLYLLDPLVGQDFKSGGRHLFPIYVLSARHFETNARKIDRDKFIFTYEQIAENAHILIRNWMTDDSGLIPIKNHLVESLIYKPVVSSVDFLQVIQAIEGVWWRYKDDDYKSAHGISKKKNTELSVILAELINEQSCIQSIHNLQINIAAAVDSRHYYSHFVEKSKKPHTLDGIELYELTKQLRTLLLSLVLGLLGLDSITIEKIISEHY